MAKQTINIGLVAGDGTGTKLRLGGDMINDNFDELYAAAAVLHTGDVTGGTNLTLATVNANVGVFNNPTLTVDGKGRITSIATIPGTLLKTFSDTINLGAGVVTQLVTTVTAEPWSVFIIDALGNILSLQVSFALVGGFYVFDIYSTDAINGVKVKILY